MTRKNESNKREYHLKGNPFYERMNRLPSQLHLCLLQNKRLITKYNNKNFSKCFTKKKNQQ